MKKLKIANLYSVKGNNKTEKTPKQKKIHMQNPRCIASQ
jgi:hypothetical protein